MTLLIDDTRDLPADLIARTFAAGKQVLEAFDVSYLKLDHDLGELKTGYDIVLLLEEWHFTGERKIPKTIELVTANSVGLKNMYAALERMYPYVKGRRLFSMEPV